MTAATGTVSGVFISLVSGPLASGLRGPLRSRPLVFRLCAPALRRQARPLAAAAVMALLRVVVELAQPWPLAVAIDYAIDGRARTGWLRPLAGMSDGAVLGLACLALILLTVASGLLGMLSTTWSEGAAEQIGADLRLRMFHRAIGLSLRWHDRVRRGELLARITTDVGRLLDAVVATLTLLVPDLALLAGVLVVLLLVNTELALLGVAVVPLLAVFAYQQRQRVRSAETLSRAEAGRLASSATDLLRNVRAVQAFGRADRAVDTFARRNQALLDADLAAVRVEARWNPIADVVLAVGSGAVLVAGGRQVMTGAITTGELVVMLSYLAVLYSPIRALCRLSGVLAKAAVSAGRVAEVLLSEEEVTDGWREATRPRHRIRLTDVGFDYVPGRPVLRRLSFDVAAGETVCLWGPSGAGKTTVLHLLLRLYDPDRGRIEFDGVDLRELQLHSLRRQIAFVPQDPWLLDASIADNIAFGAAHVTRSDIVRAARLAQLDDVIATLPEGYETGVGENGVLLSGGQRRRLALARAVVSGAALVLLDEPTASLDPAAADAVSQAIRLISPGRTVLIVTHDRSLAATADRIITLADPGVNFAAPSGRSTDSIAERR